MSITISHDYNRLRIKLSGDRKTYHAATPVAAGLAVEHYYGAAGHNRADMGGCPLCESIRKEQKA